MTQTMTLDLPRAVWMTQNGREHWRVKHRATQAVKMLARATARVQLRPAVRVHIRVVVGYPPGVGRADAENAAPTIKAAVDGIVAARILPDDSSAYVTAQTVSRGERSPARGIYRLTITLDDVAEVSADVGKG